MNNYIKQRQNHHPLIKKLKHVLQHGDRPWHLLLVTGSVFLLVLTLTIGIMLWDESSLARETFGWEFLMPSERPSWNPVTDNYRAWSFIYGTLITSVVAILLAVPVSIGIAIFMSELCPEWLKVPLNWLIELLAAIPSVVYGLWGLFVFLPIVVVPIGNVLFAAFSELPGIGIFFAGPVSLNGASRLGAAVILTIMITPTITAVTRDVLLAIPSSQREASFALGATHWETISKVLLPYGLSGILGAVILGLGRALGETMAVTMVIGNSIEGSLSILRPGYTISSVIANQFAETVSQVHYEVLIELGLILFVLTLILNSIARLLVWQVARKTPQERR